MISDSNSYSNLGWRALTFFLLAAASRLLGQTLLTDIQVSGSLNYLESGAEFTLKSSSTFTAETGSVVDLYNATVALPENLSLSSLTLGGPGNRLTSGATLTLEGGATFTAEAGSIFNLASATIAFPSTVVLTTGAQTLSGKTLVSPTIGSITAPAGSDLVLAGGDSGGTLTLGRGAGGTATFSGALLASNLSIGTSKIFTVSNTLTLTGSDGSGLNIGNGGTLRSGAFTNVGTNVRLYGAVGDGSTDDAPAIAAAIAAAGTNGLVLFPAGDYAIETGRTPLSPLPGQTLRFSDGAKLRIIPNGTFYGGALINIASDDVTIEGATFVGNANLRGTIAVGVASAKRVTLLRCTGSALLARLVIFTVGSDYGRVIGCVSPGTGPSGYASNHIEFNDSNYGLVQGNTIYGGGANGCELYQNNGRPIVGMRVIDNVFDSVGGSGVNMYGSIGAIVYGNVFRRTGSHSIFITYGEVDTALESYGNNVESNIFEDCGVDSSKGATVPIYINSPRNQIRNNSIICLNMNLVTGSAAIIVNSGDDVSVIGNFISGGRNGIYVNSTPTRTVLQSNVVVNIGTSASPGRGIQVGGSDSRIALNSIVDNRPVGQRGLEFGALATGANNAFFKNDYVGAFTSYFDSGSNNTPDTTGAFPIIRSSSVIAPALTDLTLSAGAGGNNSINLLLPGTGPVRIGSSSGSYSGSGIIALPAGATTAAGGIWFGNTSGEVIYRSAANSLTASGSLTVAGAFFSAPGSFTASAGLLRLSNGRQFNVIYNAAALSLTDGSGGGTLVTFNGGSAATAFVAIPSTLSSSSTTTGAFQVGGGVGIGGALNVGGAASIGGNLTVGANGTFGGRLRIANDFSGTNELGFYNASSATQYGTIGIASTAGALSTNAAAQDLVIRSQAALRFTAGGASDRLIISASDGGVNVTSSTGASSTTTGALTVAGGAAVQKKFFLGDELMLVPTAATSATIRLSGTAVSGLPGLWFADGGLPTSANAALSGTASTTVLNAASGGTVALRLANTDYFTLTPSSAKLETVPLKVLAGIASSSTTTGSATFVGGIGVSGRVSAGSLAVGTGSTSVPVTGMLSVLATLNFPSIAAGGGVQDLVVAVSGATVGNTVNITEAGGAFSPAGLVLHGIVSAANTVTVRATNVTGAAIDPSAISYRVTVTKF